MATIDVKDAAGTTQTIQQPNANGRAAASASRPVVLSTEDAAKVPSLGQALAAASVPVVLPALTEGLIGSLTETAPASDTASSGLNGRLQRIAQRITAMFGTAGSASANVLSVQGIASGTSLPVVSNNSEVKLSVSFTRPSDTTAYAAGDLVANSTTSGSVVALAFSNAVRTAGDCVRLERARITKTGTSLTNAQFRLHVFEDVPVPSVGDNAAFQTSNALSTTKVLNYVGSFAFTMDRSGSDGASGRAVPDTTFPITTSPVSGTTLYGLLEAQAAYTPANGEVFVVTLEGYRT